MHVALVGMVAGHHSIIQEGGSPVATPARVEVEGNWNQNPAFTRLRLFENSRRLDDFAPTVQAGMLPEVASNRLWLLDAMVERGTPPVETFAPIMNTM